VAIKHPRIASFLSVLALFVVAACATPSRNYTPVVQDPDRQTVRPNTRTGAPVLLSSLERSRVAVMQVNIPRYTQWGTNFDLKFMNIDIPNLRIDAANVTAEQAGARRPVLGRREVDAAIQASNDRMQAMSMAVGMLGALNVGMAAARPSPTSSLAASTAMQSVMVSSMTTQSFVASNTALSDVVADTHLGSVSLPPQSMANGLIAIGELEGTAPLDLTIQLGGETHRFRFQLAAE
jgi:hypothetical protein